MPKIGFCKKLFWFLKCLKEKNEEWIQKELHECSSTMARIVCVGPITFEEHLKIFLRFLLWTTSLHTNYEVFSIKTLTKKYPRTHGFIIQIEIGFAISICMQND